MGRTYPVNKTNSYRLDRYREALVRIPRPGCGCHTSLLSVANLGVLAEVSPQEIFDDIRRNIQQGSRRVFDREIMDAVNKALADHSAGKFTPKPKPIPVVQDGKAALRRVIAQSKISDEAALKELSPVRLLEAV